MLNPNKKKYSYIIQEWNRQYRRIHKTIQSNLTRILKGTILNFYVKIKCTNVTFVFINCQSMWYYYHLEIVPVVKLLPYWKVIN